MGYITHIKVEIGHITMISSFDSLPKDWEIVLGKDLFSQSNIRVKDSTCIDSIPVLSMTRYNGLILQSKKFDKQVASRDLSNYKVVIKGQLVYGFPIDEGVIAVQHLGIKHTSRTTAVDMAINTTNGFTIAYLISTMRLMEMSSGLWSCSMITLLNL